jgi:hypothetical protein
MLEVRRRRPEKREGLKEGVGGSLEEVNGGGADV